MPPRAKSTASLPLIHGYSIALFQDDRADWRFGSITHGLDDVPAPISAEDRQRPFRTSWAAAEFFRRYYGEGLPKPAGSP